jgi:hypothetical protein
MCARDGCGSVDAPVHAFIMCDVVLCLASPCGRVFRATDSLSGG